MPNQYDPYIVNPFSLTIIDLEQTMNPNILIS